jgi:hypothetical protein
MASYELWQTQTRNLIGTFATEAEALEVVRRAADSHGSDYIDTIFLGHEDNVGHSRMVAEGKALLQMARQGEQAPSDG